MTSFGRFIKTEREKNGWNQTEFGALIKINAPLVSRIENDKKMLPPKKVKALAELFKLDYSMVKDLYFADKFAKEAFKNNCSGDVFVVAETEVVYLRDLHTRQAEIKF